MKSSTWDQYVPIGLMVRMLVYLSILIVPILLLSRYQFMPFDDCLRHAAKAVSGKSWSEVLILRPGINFDQHPGWHAFLGLLHARLGLGKELLVMVEWIGLFTLVAMIALPFFKRPEAWVAAMLMANLALPESYIFRMTRGRPYLLTEAVLMILLVIWGRSERRTVALLVITTALLALSIWVHGAACYLWLLLVLVLILAGRHQDAFSFAGCWLAGALLGGALTGHPIAYLGEQLQVLFQSFGNGGVNRMLVGEFQPSSGALSYLLLFGFVYVARGLAVGLWVPLKAERVLAAMGLTGWLGGLWVLRFWSEWGLPAFQLWLAFIIQDLLVKGFPDKSGKSLLLAFGCSLAFVFSSASDLGGRWSGEVLPDRSGGCTNGNDNVMATAQDKAGWMPDPGGLVYNSQMYIFMTFFFEYPTAPWRYVYGYEAGLMTKENLRVLRNIQYNFMSWESYRPWVGKMSPLDRLIIQSAARPGIEDLEWREIYTGVWSGRRPACNHLGNGRAVHSGGRCAESGVTPLPR